MVDNPRDQMKIGVSVTVSTTQLELYPAGFGHVESRADLVEQLGQILMERLSYDWQFNGEDLEAFYKRLQRQGDAPPDGGDVNA